MKRSLLLSVIVLCFSCSRPLPDLDRFDQKAWKDDPKGCMGSRESQLASLREQREKLKGLSERDVVTLLGLPDANDLSEHNGKFYYYFITPGPGCVGIDSLGLALIVRFNATGVSREVAIE
ncbi:MAG: hypothetical protein WDO14_24155 [Bacteroidota bacterium]